MLISYLFLLTSFISSDKVIAFERDDYWYYCFDIFDTLFKSNLSENQQWKELINLKCYEPSIWTITSFENAPDICLFEVACSNNCRKKAVIDRNIKLMFLNLLIVIKYSKIFRITKSKTKKQLKNFFTVSLIKSNKDSDL